MYSLTIAQVRGTKAQLTATNAVIQADQLCIELDTNIYTVGNGAGAYNSIRGNSSLTSDERRSADDVHYASLNAPSGGGGAVDSVNGETGVVVLDATDVGADPAGSAAAAQAASDPLKTLQTTAATAITLTADHFGKITECTAETTITVTVPISLGLSGVKTAYFTQSNTAQVVFVTSGGAVIRSTTGALGTYGQYATVALRTTLTTDAYNLSGQVG